MMQKCVNASVVSRCHLPNTLSWLQAPGQDHQAAYGTSFTLHPWRDSQPRLWLLNILPGQTLYIPYHLDVLEICNLEGYIFSSSWLEPQILKPHSHQMNARTPILSDLWPKMAQLGIKGTIADMWPQWQCYLKAEVGVTRHAGLEPL